MPQPAAKPTTAIAEWLSTASTVGELHVMHDACLGSGVPRDVVGNVLGVPYAGVSGAGMGHPPSVVTGYNGESVLRFGAGTTGIRYPGRGWGAHAAGRTIWCVFRPVYGAGPIAKQVGVFGSGSDSFFNGVGLSISTAGVITLGRLSASSFTSVGVTLTSGKTYVVAYTYNTTTNIIVQVYCYDDQAYLTTQATGASVAVTAPSTSQGPDAVLNPLTTIDGYQFYPLVGDVFACGLSAGTMDPATNGYFAALVADPCAVARGTYSGGGGLTAGGVCAYDSTTSQVVIHSNRPSGGTPASYQYRLHGSDTPGFTPGAGTRIGALQSSPKLADTTLGAGATRWYKVEQFDGTSTVFSTTGGSNATQVSSRLSRGDFFFLSISDSRWSSSFASSPVNIAFTLAAYGYRTGWINAGAGSSLILSASVGSSWQPSTTGAYNDATNGQAGTSLLRNALTAGADAGVSYVLSSLGVNDALAGTAAATSATRYQTISAVITGAGFTHVIVPPYQCYSGTEAQNALIPAYRAAFAALDNGTTRRISGNTGAEFFEGDLGRWARDGLHAQAGWDGLAAAWDLYKGVLGGLSYAAASHVRSGVNRGDGTLGTLVVPAAANVLTGTTYDGATQGTATVPNASDVKGGTTYGAGGNALTGSYSPSYASAGNVRSGIDRGDGTQGTLVVPAAGNVRSGTTFDNGTQGTLTLPLAGQVLSGVQYGSGGTQYTGTYASPTFAAAGDVRSGVNRGDGTLGTLAVPDAGDVRSGTQYGAGGTEYTGTLVVTGGGGGGGGTGPTAAEIAAAVLGTTMSEGYAADGKSPTLSQFAHMVLQRLTEFEVQGTVLVVRRLDGQNVAYTVSLNSASEPTGCTRP